MKRPQGKLRIIGGEFRSRLVEFSQSGVRPTPDRVRQTLFDWLAPTIEGVRCLDLFAGSGALGLEALSRGAASADFVDSGPVQVAAIKAAVERLGVADRSAVHCRDAVGFLRSSSRVYDVVFLDPPFGSDLLAPAFAALPPCLSADSRVYFEQPRGGKLALPSGFDVLREKQAGQVSYALASFTGVPA